jgi:eukaryotic-like serine/threonine-protein kinase
LEGLDYLHREKNVIHCDLKPKNIGLQKVQGEPPVLKIYDFGLSHEMRTSEQIATMKTICGTKGYLAPEITKTARSGVSITPAIDMWAFGVILF